MHPEQDRILDDGTVQTFCLGCPFLAIKQNKNVKQTVIDKDGKVISNADFGENKVDFSEVGQRYAEIKKVVYECTSPEPTRKQYLYQQLSGFPTAIGGGGFCSRYYDKYTLELPDTSDM
jgi:hypothetical protein